MKQARQMVNHGHILVNGAVVNIPSFKIIVGDEISLREKSKKVEMFTSNITSTLLSVSYIEKDTETLAGRLIKLPGSGEVPVEVKYSKVLEYYSKN